MFEGPRLDDEEYFKTYPAPLFKAMWEMTCGTPMNSTTPYYGPLLYWLCRCACAFDVLEIGVCHGWSSAFMARAVAEQNSRHQANGFYYGNDVGDVSEIFREFHKAGLTNTKFIQKDSWDLVPADWDNRTLGLVFQDGWHSRGHVFKELEIVSPYLADRGNGYWVMHDIYSHCESLFDDIKKLHPTWEVIRFYTNYGLAIFRNMDNYDYNAIHWPNGPEAEIR
jgi:hypothetical protein